MNKTLVITWVILLVLTFTTALAGNIQSTYVVVVIMILATLKFLGVTFQFMELKKAHSFWKYLIVLYVILFTTLVVII